MNRVVQLLRALPLALVLALSTPSPTLAQEVGAAAGESEGKPLFGYLAAGAGSIAILFVLCISARR